DPATATAKYEAILTAWRTADRRVLKAKRTDAWLDGEDAGLDGPDWVSTRFEIELAEGSDEARYTLDIDTKEDQNGRRIVYSGTAYAKTLLDLLATVETAAGGKHPVEIGSELKIQFQTDDEGTEKLAQATFSREYAAA